MTRVLVPLAAGFEEIEAITVIDVLRRAEVEVVVAGLEAGVLNGSRGIKVEPDTTLDAVDTESFDMVVLPGGIGGTMAMIEDERVLDLLRTQLSAGRRAAAICAAPMVLAAAGVEEGLEVTSHPSVRERLGRASVRDTRVVRSGSVMTSQGPGTSMEFALALVEDLCGALKRDELASGMCVD